MRWLRYQAVLVRYSGELMLLLIRERRGRRLRGRELKCSEEDGVQVLVWGTEGLWGPREQELAP